MQLPQKAFPKGFWSLFFPSGRLCREKNAAVGAQPACPWVQRAPTTAVSLRLSNYLLHLTNGSLNVVWSCNGIFPFISAFYPLNLLAVKKKKTKPNLTPAFGGVSHVPPQGYVHPGFTGFESPHNDCMLWHSVATRQREAGKRVAAGEAPALWFSGHDPWFSTARI